MSTQVQFRRGTTSDISTFVGASGEVIVDTTKHTCVVNDGVQVAGYPLLREDGSNSSLIPGSTSSCSLKFANDSNTGIISPGSDQIALVTGGATRLAIDSAGSVSIAGNLLVSGALSGSFQFSDGSAASPSITFINDPDTGIFRGAANQIGIATGGTERLRVDSAGAATIFNSLTTTNSNTAASFIPTGGTAPANGIYLPTTNTIGIATNSTARFTVSTTAASSTLPIDVPLGSVSAPPITFTGDLNTGIYSPGADQVAISTNGQGRLFVDASGNIGAGASSPAFAAGGGVQAKYATFSSFRATVGANTGTDFSAASDGKGYVYVRDNADLLIGTNNTERLRITSTGALNFVGAGTAGVTQAVSFNGSAPVNSLVIDSSGRLGVGTSSPTNTAGFSQQLQLSGNLPCISIDNTGTGANKYSLGVNSVGALGIWDNTASAFRMYINSSGSVGIGTSSPSNILHVVSADTTTPGFFQLSDATTTLGNSFNTIHRTGNDGDNRYSLSAWQVQNTSGLTQRAFIGARAVTGAANYNPLMVFGTTTGSGTYSTRMVIDGSGNVGIGTTSPNNKLEVVGAGYFTDWVYTGSGSGSRGISSDSSTRALLFGVNGSEVGRFDTSGRLLVGTSSSYGVGSSAQAKFQASDTTSNIHASFTDWSTANSGGIIVLGKAKGGSAGNYTIVANNDILGEIRFAGADGTDLETNGALIRAEVDGTPGANDMPGRLVFSTTADGASSPTERMRIHSTGNTSLSGGISLGGLGDPGSYIVFNGSVIGSGAGTYALKWSNTNGRVTYDTSSRLIKEEIVDCPYGIDELKQLQPRKYFRTDDQREEIGFVADEVALVMPEFVPVGPKSVITRNDEDTEEIPLGVNYDKLTAVLTKALQEAVAKIESLEARLTAAGI